MKLDKILLNIFIVFTCISILSIVTPLSFANIWIRNGWYLMTILLSIIVGLRMKNWRFRHLITWIPLSFFLTLICLSYINSLADRRTDKWRTSWISHRKENSQIYIGEQVLDIGARGYARRVVKVVPMSPLFDWVTKIDTTTLDKTWIRVFEGYNPYNLK